MNRWWIFIKERFSPASYLPMIFLFSGVNAFYGLKLESHPWNGSRFAVVFLMMLSFFFRMRLFDEIKDYEVDLKVNPTRPLARGLLSIPEVKNILRVLILAELVVAGFLGLPAFIIHLFAVLYSLLMYKEFFIGSLLRPHLTTYAVTHTFVSVLLGISSAVAITGNDPSTWPLESVSFFLLNWAYFNLFEFARKTFASSEERPHVPSYSNIFGPWGAMLLSLSQGFIGFYIAEVFIQSSYLKPLWILYAAVGLTFVFIKKPFTASIFRNFSGLYLLLNYLIIAMTLGV